MVTELTSALAVEKNLSQMYVNPRFLCHGGYSESDDASVWNFTSLVNKVAYFFRVPPCAAMYTETWYKYFFLAALSVLLWDHLTTLPDEVRL